METEGVLVGGGASRAGVVVGGGEGVHCLQVHKYLLQVLSGIGGVPV